MRLLLVLLILSVIFHFSANGAVAKEWATEEAKRAFGTPEDIVNPELLKSKKSFYPKKKTVNKKSIAKINKENAVTEPTPSYTYTDKDLPSRETVSETGIDTYVQELLGLPEQIKVECILGIGYPAEQKKPVSAETLQYDKIRNNRW